MNDQNTQTRKLSRDELTVALSGWRQEDTVATMLMGMLRGQLEICSVVAARRKIHSLGWRYESWVYADL